MRSTCIAKCAEFKISYIEGVSEKTGKAYNFYSLERGYKNAAGKWENERITLNSRDLPVMQILLKHASHMDAEEQARLLNQKSNNEGVA